MIGRLRGILLEKQVPTLVVEAGGVGYEVQAPMTSFYQLPDLGKEVILHTHLVVREDAQILFGFVTKEERKLFRTLIKISGVGPKLALTILSGIEPDAFVQCILDGDITSLVRLPGVGKKSAERLIVEMRGRLKDWQSGSLLDADSNGTTTGGAMQDALSALIALGYKSPDASRALAKHKGENLSSEELIRIVLKDIG